MTTGRYGKPPQLASWLAASGGVGVQCQEYHLPGFQKRLTERTQNRHEAATKSLIVPRRPSSAIDHACLVVTPAHAITKGQRRLVVGLSGGWCCRSPRMSPLQPYGLRCGWMRWDGGLLRARARARRLWGSHADSIAMAVGFASHGNSCLGSSRPSIAMQNTKQVLSMMKYE